MEKERYGIYGGTFSPPHNGHVHAARRFLEKEALDRLLIIPVCIPPHKEPDHAATAEERMEMCRLAFSFSDRVEVSDMEIRRQGRSYTVDTLRALRHPNRQLVLLCGADMFLTLPEWHEAEEIFRLAEIVYVERDEVSSAATEQAAVRYRAEYGATVRRLSCSCVETASSAVRAARGAKREEWRDALPPAVAKYVEKKGLYI